MMWDFNKQDVVTFLLGFSVGMVVSVTWMALIIR